MIKMNAHGGEARWNSTPSEGGLQTGMRAWAGVPGPGRVQRAGGLATESALPSVH